ncbi:MAG: DEAD/DEAH box helicase [Bacteroidales bacterium]|jgi:superfamily II DNA or RNA helicase|nr:DEAD/DEAH box helicase [Bacteroidales bacterium]
MNKQVEKKLGAKKAEKRPSIAYHSKPDNMSLEEWQIALRKQYAEMKSFIINKIDSSRFLFGDYEVVNTDTGNRYKVAFRGVDNPMNFCSCMDFKTNHLGTCKHIESVLLHVQNRLSKVHKEQKYEQGYTSVYLSYKNGREVKIRIGTLHEDKFQQLAKQYFDSQYTLFPDAIFNFEKFLTEAGEIDDSFRCYPDALSYVLELREKNTCHILSEKYQTAEDFASIIQANLFPYQQAGVRFAFSAGKSLIADEMGLGKTIQAIGACQMFKAERGIEKVLVICPTSLKYQWQSEIKRFTGETALVIEGNPLKRWEQYQQDHFYKIASYHTVANDIAQIADQKFDLLVLDEAQRVKNWNTKLAKAIKKIQTPYNIVLTGTPLENKLQELYSIVQIVDPYILGPYYQFLHRYQIADDTGKVTGYQHLNEIGKILAHTVIRRRKNEVLLQLPDRMDKNLFVPMTEEQLILHQECQDIVARLVNKWKRMKFLSESDRQKLMINLNMMRMSCNSTFLFDQKTRHDTKIDELLSILLEYFEGNEEKAVIFSQWERMTRIIAGELDKAGIPYQYLHGGVPAKDRKALFDIFNGSGDCRVFLSTDAGSTGLNLQSASLVINMDIPWNPAVLEQRVARIHRMGQKKSVSVINFVSKNTIEHRMLDVLKFKTSLAQGILDQGENAIFMTDSKFNVFMKEIEAMTVTEDTGIETIPTLREEEAVEPKELSPVLMSGLQPEIPFDTPIEGDDDVRPVEQEKQPSVQPTPESPTDHSRAVSEAADVLSQGLSFLSRIAITLASPEKTEMLVRSIVEKDTTTGKTHLKIPVENEETVSNVLNLIGQLFKGINK